MPGARFSRMNQKECLAPRLTPLIGLILVGDRADRIEKHRRHGW
jgi:hypothetical protein